MRGHIPFLAALVPGLVSAVNGNERRSFLVSGGFLEASGTLDDYHVILLADDAEEVGELEPAEIARRIDELRRREDDNTGEDEDRAEAALRASLAQGERATGEYSAAT